MWQKAGLVAKQASLPFEFAFGHARRQTRKASSKGKVERQGRKGNLERQARKAGSKGKKLKSQRRKAQGRHQQGEQGNDNAMQRTIETKGTGVSVCACVLWRQREGGALRDCDALEGGDFKGNV